MDRSGDLSSAQPRKNREASYSREGSRSSQHASAPAEEVFTEASCVGLRREVAVRGGDDLLIPGNAYDGVRSRDGSQIAYIASKAGTLQLWTQPAEGGEPRQLTFGHERMRHPSFSPDGRWIYVQPSHRNIWRVPAAGGPLEPVTRFLESGLFLEEPALSPDGRTLAYARSKGGSSLWLLSLGSRESAVTATP